MTTPTRPAEETARLGDEIYDRDIRPQVEETCHGKIVAIDVDSGNYAVADTVVAAAERLRSQHRTPPSGVSGSGTARCTASGEGHCGGRSDRGCREY